MKTYPEHDKLHKIKDESQSIGTFLDWLQNERNITLSQPHEHDDGCGHIPSRKNRDVLQGDCGYCEDQLVAVHTSIEKLLAEYFKIDLKVIEQEKREMLEEIRKIK